MEKHREVKYKLSSEKALFEVMHLKRDKVQAPSERTCTEQLGVSYFKDFFKGQRV